MAILRMVVGFVLTLLSWPCNAQNIESTDELTVSVPRCEVRELQTECSVYFYLKQDLGDLWVYVNDSSIYNNELEVVKGTKADVEMSTGWFGWITGYTYVTAPMDDPGDRFHVRLYFDHSMLPNLDPDFLDVSVEWSYSTWLNTLLGTLCMMATHVGSDPDAPPPDISGCVRGREARTFTFKLKP